MTATAKPAVSPVAGKLRGSRLESDFCPEMADSGVSLTTDRFRKLLSAEGFQVIGPAETGDARAKNARGWTEYGEFDELGHTLQGKLAARIEDQLELLLERVQGLLEAGWKRVRVVTDHGWLLVPGGMPKVQLPKYLAESRWSRCASIKDSSHVEVPIAGWSWNPQERFAYAPGVHCFVVGQEYAHGGASLQECLIPVLTLASTGAPAGVVVTRERGPVGGTALPGERATARPKGCWPICARRPMSRTQALPNPRPWTPTGRPRFWLPTIPSKGQWPAS